MAMSAIKIGLACNAGIACAKGLAAVMTGSPSMVAETVHSIADTANQGLLLVNRARLAAGIMSALGLGIIVESLHKLAHPEPAGNLMWAFGILSLSIFLETVSLVNAIKASRAGSTDSLLVLVVEDLAALTGLAIAVLSVAAAAQTGEPRYDALGGVAIGLLEALSGLFLTIRMWRDR
jgi:divalent metal cation (Fe/Co/Zn/Cd) transporter